MGLQRVYLLRPHSFVGGPPRPRDVYRLGRFVSCNSRGGEDAFDLVHAVLAEIEFAGDLK